MQLLRLTEVTRATGLGRSTVYRKIADGTFPQPLKLSAGCVRWDSDDLAQWKTELRAANDNKMTAAKAA